MTGVNLELLTDPDMHLFIERGLRGGISRYAKANNPYVDDYNPNQPSNYLIYLDANNLYGWSMSQALPTQGFRWLSRQEIDSYDVFQGGENTEQGYILSVDMEYPGYLHDAHSDYPLAPESFEVKSDILSPYQQNLLRKLDLGENSTKKLVPNLYNKKDYVVHYRNLQLYLSFGMKVTKVHKILSFQQKPWLREYIDFNTNMRKAANNDFEKDFYKLMNKKHLDASVKERPQTLLIPSEQICKRVLCNKHI